MSKYIFEEQPEVVGASNPGEASKRSADNIVIASLRSFAPLLSNCNNI